MIFDLLDQFLIPFLEEEIYTLQQVASLKEHHLHEWMGVKTGTVLTMLDAIKKIRMSQPIFSIPGCCAPRALF